MLAWSRICCAVDFSESSRRALTVATDVTRLVRAELTLLYVWQPPILALPEMATYAPPALWERMETEAAAMLERWRSEAEHATRCERRVVAVERAGIPSEEIVRFTEDERTDLLVVGTHGRSGLQRALLGSVAERVLRNAPCPVLAIRPTGH